MKKAFYILLALVSVSVIALATGCSKAPESIDEPGTSANTETGSVSETGEETGTPITDPTELHFKTGTWATSEGTNFVFYENGKDGKTVSVTEQIALVFEYELNADGSGIFHIGSTDDTTKATVAFTDGDRNAVINWEDGTRTELTFVSEDTSDDFVFHYVTEQIAE